MKETDCKVVISKEEVRRFYDECRKVSQKQHPAVVMCLVGADASGVAKAYGVRGIMARLKELENEPAAQTDGVVIWLDATENGGGFQGECQPCACVYKYAACAVRNDEHFDKANQKLCPSCNADALKGLLVVVTGKFAEGVKEQVKQLVVMAGGSLRTAVSGKVSYLVCGPDGVGERKVEEARRLGVACLTVEEFFNLIKSWEYEEV